MCSIDHSPGLSHIVMIMRRFWSMAFLTWSMPTKHIVAQLEDRGATPRVQDDGPGARRGRGRGGGGGGGGGTGPAMVRTYATTSSICFGVSAPFHGTMLVGGRPFSTA